MFALLMLDKFTFVRILAARWRAFGDRWRRIPDRPDGYCRLVSAGVSP